MSRLPADRHRPMRAGFAGLFSARRVERYRAVIRDRVHALIHQLPPMGTVDLVPAFARPLPFAVLADVLGVSPDRQEWLSSAMTTFGEAVAAQRDHAQVERGNDATREMLDYFDQALAERRRRPREDLLTLLAAGDSLPGGGRADLVANCLFFVLAGHATTSSLLPAGVQLLLEHRDQLEVLHRDPEQWPRAVDEMLRYVSPTTLTGATATTDVVVDGCPVGADVQRTLVFARTVTQTCSTIRTHSTSRGHQTPIWPSLPVRTTASARRWLGCMPRSRSPLSSAACLGYG